MKICGEKHEITVDSENFLKLFKIHNSNRKILKETSDEVERIKRIKRDFNEATKAFNGKDLVDLYFEFQVSVLKCSLIVVIKILIPLID